MPVINPRTGQEFRWASKPKPTTRARWHKQTMYGGRVKGSIRAIAHLDRLNNLARHKYNQELVVIQSAFNSTIAASAGTHDYDMCYDVYIPGVGWWETQRFLRRNGFFCWYRPTTPGLWSNHVHGFSMPHWTGSDPSAAFAQHGFKVGVYIDGGISLYGHKVATSQVDDQIDHAFGLKDQHVPGSDHSWFPLDPAATIFDLSAYVARRAAIQATG